MAAEQRMGFTADLAIDPRWGHVQPLAGRKLGTVESGKKGCVRTWNCIRLYNRTSYYSDSCNQGSRGSLSRKTAGMASE